MRRREFTGLLLGAIVAQYPAAAQQPGKVLRIGILAPGPLRPIASFKQHLRDLGWIEGSNIRFEDRWAEGDDTRYAEFAVELATLPVDAILTWSTPSVLAAKRATTVIQLPTLLRHLARGLGTAASGPRAAGVSTYSGQSLTRMRPLPSPNLPRPPKCYQIR